MITSFQDLLTAVSRLISILLPLAVGVALLVFLWGLASFIRESDNVDKRTEGKNRMIWGIISLFVMTSIWGIVSFLQGSLFGYSIVRSPTRSDAGYYVDGTPCEPADINTPSCDFDANGNLLPPNQASQSNQPSYGIPIKSR